MREQSILLLSKSSVSWLTCEPQAQVLHREFADGDLAAAKVAKSMLKDGRVKAGACVLALDDSYYKRRQFDLPSDLTGRELKEVLTRKANGLVGPDGRAVFQALPLHGNRKSRRDGVRSWALFAIESQKLVQLTEELRRAGFAVKRVIAAEVAYNGNLHMPELGDSDAVIQIGQLDSGIGVSLFCQDGLVTQYVAPTGDFGRETVGSAIVQELRSMDSYWRQISEGGSVTHAALSGFDQDWADQISPATQMVLPNVELHFGQDLPVVTADKEMLAHMLLNCKSQGPLMVDFSLATAPHKLVTVALTAASVACGLSLGYFALNQLEATTGRIESSIHARSAEVDAESEARGLQAELDSKHAIENEFQAEWNAVMSTASTNIAYAQICEDVMEAIGAEGALESLKVTRGQPLAGIQVTGVVPAQTAPATSALDSIRRRLSGTGAFHNLEVAPESRIPGPEGASQLLRFTISGKWDSSFALAVGENPTR